MDFQWSNNRDDGRLKSVDIEEAPLIPKEEIELRYLIPEDLEEVKMLCQEWFPIDYPLQWYEDITSSNRFFALAAIYNLAIIGLIVSEIKPYARLNKEDRGLLSESMGKDSDIGYILSLGVHRKYRRNGIGTLLLDAYLLHLTTSECSRVKAIYLHVLTTNQAAINFYERRQFSLHSFLPYYYSIRGKSKDGFSYCKYINGGHYPFTLYDHIKNICSFLCHMKVFKFLIGRFRALFRWISYHTINRFKFFAQ